MKTNIIYIVASSCFVIHSVAWADSLSLGDSKSFPTDQAIALVAAANEVKSRGYEPQEFNARVNCNDEVCEIAVYPKELDSDEYPSYRGCPLKFCATMSYSKDTQGIVKVMGWR